MMESRALEFLLGYKCRLQVESTYLFISNREVIYFMSIEDRLDATAKNIEGKVQEAVGEVTGDQSEKAEGQAKQAQASTEHAVENAKDKLKEAIDKA